MEREGARLAELATAVRDSTVKRLRRVPPGRENWRPTSHSMSCSDLGQHLLDADRWFLRVLDGDIANPVEGHPGMRAIGSRSEYDSLVTELEAMGLQRAARFASLSAVVLSQKYHDPRFGREVTLWWGAFRGNLDHETHHRGQIAVYLRLIEAT